MRGSSESPSLNWTMAPPDPQITLPPKRDWRFWVIFIALCLSIALCGLDIGALATALPSIIHDLNGTDSFAWVSTGYTLATTAILPLSGRLAEVLGRRDVLLASLVLFAVGSAVCGAAHSMTVLVAGRVIQGIGSGGIQSLTAIVVADVVPLKDRGLFNALIGMTFSVTTAAGPFIGGVIVQKTTWRWLFYINLPMAGLAVISVFGFLRLRQPSRPNFLQCVASLDLLGNTMIIGSATSCILALTWAGVTHPWNSTRVLAPLIIGMVGLVGALLYEMFIAGYPSIPRSIVSNCTSLSGYIASFIHGLIITSVAFYLPVYFQGVKEALPLLSGLYIFPMAAVISPSAILQGVLISKFGRYKLVSGIGWSAMMLGVGLLLILNINTSIGTTVPLQLIAAFGFGLLYATTFTVLAPLDVGLNSAALSLLLFARTFSQSWSIAIGATILQNELRHQLPAEFIASFVPGQDLTYVSIPLIRSLSEPLRTQVRIAFANSLRLMWKVLLGLCGAGLLTVFLQREIPLHRNTNPRWGIKDNENKASESTDAEKSNATPQ
ncbi:MFS general substrate transporter [Mycena alexandri]|uniref:MFS general substrate transporter n=1 Tax=Mycena alexandri TaxID=1745969 RepID=A0AAD6RVQ4_9AGAR|nr:MFS general substrate transporter [Mycena alexandri]